MAKRKLDPRSVTPLDKRVAAKIRQARAEAGLSQQALAALTGITFQQIQKYEKGANRVSVGRFHQIITALNKPASYFVEEWAS